jgi:hypothetical protein
MNLPADPPTDHRPEPLRPAGARAADQAARRRRLDRIFGEVLPEVTGDERNPEVAPESSDADRWYLENRPPHHG